MSRKKAWSLHGREAEIALLRDDKKLTFEEIGRVIGCTGEGARQAYQRHLASLKSEDMDDGA